MPTSSPSAAGRALRGLLGLLVLVLTACGAARSPVEEQARSGTAEGAAAATTLQPADVVELTVYFRQGIGAQAHLVPVSRGVPVAADLPRRALELLLAGPEPEDGAGLAAPLPTSTAVLDFSVEGEVARLDLSAEVITDRASVGASAAHELLALAAMANTLTEFPEIEQIDVTVAGRSRGPVEEAGAVTDVAAFWGWWGLPDRLHRDESVVGPSPDGTDLPDLEHFVSREQSVGVDGARARVDDVRVRQRATSVRVTVELGDTAGDGAPPPVPPATARATGDGVLLEIASVTGVGDDVDLGAAVPLSGHPATALTVDGDPPGTLRVLVATATRRDFRLHTLTGPSRIVLDLRT